jgi:hypothetical protein
LEPRALFARKTLHRRPAGTQHNASRHLTAEDIALMSMLIRSTKAGCAQAQPRSHVYTAITLLTLAIGVGANTVIFSVVDGVLLKPLPYPHAEQLIGVWHTAPGINIPDLNMAPSIYFIDREQNTTLQDIGVYDGDSFNVTGTGEPEHVRGLDVTDGTLPLLGVTAGAGPPVLTRQDDTAAAPPP